MIDYFEKIENAKSRMESFWNREDTDRCLLTLPSLKEGAFFPAAVKGLTVEQKWLDVDYRIDRFHKESEAIFFGGDAIPVFFINLGPGVLAEFITGKFKLGENTVWFEEPPFIEYENRKPLKFLENSVLYHKMRELQSACAKEKIFVTTTDLGGTLDIAASLRGTENVLFDLLEEEENLAILCKEIDNLWNSSLKEIIERDSKNQKGFSSWINLWHDKPFATLQCDLSVNFSPELFEKLVIPSLKEQSKYLDKVIYHLDGPEEIKHLDLLLDLDFIDAIQCVALPLSDRSGYLGTATKEWMQVYKRIQAAGKNLIISSPAPKDFKTLMTNLSHRGLCIMSSMSKQSDVEDVLIQAKSWAKEKKYE